MGVSVVWMGEWVWLGECGSTCVSMYVSIFMDVCQRDLWAELRECLVEMLVFSFVVFFCFVFRLRYACFLFQTEMCCVFLFID